MPEVIFDNALGTVVKAVEASGLHLDGLEITLVRDLLGRIRLHVGVPEERGGKLTQEEKDRLRRALSAAGPYATEGVHDDALGKPSFPLADRLSTERKPLELAAPRQAGSPLWYHFERRFSKDSWLQETGRGREPWPLAMGAPVVISFFGFKGGVGRTTALAAFSLYLADMGKNVVAVDLDLEAPGLAPLLAGGIDPDLGVVDFLLEERIGHATPLALSRFYISSPHASGPGSVRIFPAGRLDVNYLEKLGRIDVQGVVQTEHSVRHLLTRLLQRIRDELSPDAILLDVRAGLHDLGGISLAGLSHLELIFAVHSEQSWTGLPLVLRHLGRLRADWIKLVHAMVPPAGRGGDELHDEFVTRAYDLCSDLYYLAEDIPGPQDESAAHWAYRLSFREALMGLSDLQASRADLLADEHRIFCAQLARDAGLEG